MGDPVLDRLGELERLLGAPAVLFAAAQEKPPGERDAFLGRACDGDTALRQEVESLLAAGPEADRFFDSLAGDAIPQALAALTEPTGGRVGRTYGAYEVVE